MLAVWLPGPQATSSATLARRSNDCQLRRSLWWRAKSDDRKMSTPFSYGRATGSSWSCRAGENLYAALSTTSTSCRPSSSGTMAVRRACAQTPATASGSSRTIRHRYARGKSDGRNVPFAAPRRAAPRCPDELAARPPRLREGGGEAGRGAVGGPQDAPPYLRLDPVPAGLQREAGAGLARPPFGRVHARDLRPPAPGRPAGAAAGPPARVGRIQA
jgi:hypothetical protein